jgi:hypothetical protein
MSIDLDLALTIADRKGLELVAILIDEQYKNTSNK